MLKQTILTLGIAAMIAGCTPSSKAVKTEQPVAEGAGTTVFVDKNGGIYTVNTLDYYDTAKFTDANGKIYNLKSQPSANGIRLVEGNTEVFFKDEYVSMTIDGKEIPVTVKKSF